MDLGTLIRKYDFLHGTQAAQDALHFDICKYLYPNGSDGRPTPLDELIRGVAALKERVCVKGFPGRMSPACWMARDTIMKILSHMTESIGKGIVRKEDCQKIILDYIWASLWTGPGSTHCEVLNDVIGGLLELDDYITGLRGEELTRTIDVLKCLSHTSEQPEISLRQQCSFWSNFMTKFMKKLVGHRENQKAHEPDIHVQFLDLYMFYLLKMTDMPEEYSSSCIESVMDTILEPYSRGRYNRKPYHELQDMDFIRKHLKILENLICSEKFGQNQTQVKCATDCVGYIFEIKEESTIEQIWGDLCAFMKTISLSKTSGKFSDLFAKFKYLNRDIPDEKYKENPGLIDRWIPVVSEVLHTAPSLENVEPWVFDIVYSMKERCILKKKGSAAEWCPIVKGLLKWPHVQSIKNAINILKEGKFKKIWTWKENYKEAGEMISIIATTDHPTDGDRKAKDLLSSYGDCIEVLIEQLSTVKVVDKIGANVAELTISILEKRSTFLNGLPARFSARNTLVKNNDVIPNIVRRLTALMIDPDYPWDELDATNVGTNLIAKIIEAYSQGTEIPDEVNEGMIQIFRYCIETEGLDYMNMEYETPTIYSHVVSTYLTLFMMKHISCETYPVCEPLMPAIIQLMTSDEEVLQLASMTLVSMIAMQAPALMTPYLSVMIQWYKETNEINALTSLWRPYPLSSGLSQGEFDDLIEACLTDSSTNALPMQTMLLKDIAEKQPQLFNQKTLDRMMVKYMNEKNAQFSALMALRAVSQKKPQFFGDNFVQHVMKNPNIDLSYSSAIHNIGFNIVRNNKKMMNTMVNEFMALAKRCENPDHKGVLVDAVRAIASECGLECLKQHRPYFEQMRKTGETAALKDMATNIINALEGRSLLTVSEELQQQKEAIKVIDTKVKDTAKEVKVIKKTVVKHDKDIKGVKKGLTKVNKRVDVVEEDLAETKVKVEEVDKKTMSNAPTWSRDLTKLMNPKSKHDWTLLAQRLGYTASDIKGWATQQDPCMALLSEWYATHKTIEATHGVLTALQEMNRLDAAIIVENAMKAVEDIVEEAPEYTKPPPIFLSYQWGHQNEVKLLRNHLQMAGYECWMDVGQMGGGDKLFEKIDVGIRGAKVIICCVSEKYAKSPNCNREVNLSVNLGKPMIPLLMEKMGWPPKGSMGPIFSEYLFVRFFQRGGEETNDDRYWPVPKFQEILMQLNMYKALPDESLITGEYKNWWVPVAEEIVINKKKTDGGQGSQGQKTATSTEEEEKSPDVFLSYQWGKQKQIKMLYKRLTELGFTCWMDIHQMGGGDSLYDKIDKGVRGCKIVLSCVTTKYALSANCRREVSLADSLKKPLVPLLLEKIDWPPSGPMSMVFTQLLFINFYRDENVQMTWTGEKFDELLAKIVDNVPECVSFLDDWGKATTKPTEAKVTNQEKAPVAKPEENVPKQVSETPDKQMNNTQTDGNMKSASAAAVAGKTELKKDPIQAADKPREKAENKENMVQSKNKEAVEKDGPRKENMEDRKKEGPQNTVGMKNEQKDEGKKVEVKKEETPRSPVKAEVQPNKKSSTCDIL